jgi:hypothetical protein
MKLRSFTQEEIRRSKELLGDPDLTVREVADKLGRSTGWVLRKFRKEPGTLNLGPHSFRIPVDVYNRVMSR